MTNTMETILQASERLSNGNDRYLFVATIIVLGAFITAAMRWLVSQNKALWEDNKKDRIAYEEKLERIISGHQLQLEQMIRSRDDNTHAIERNTDALNEVKGRLSMQTA